MVEIVRTHIDSSHCPVPQYPYLYVPCYFDYAAKHATTNYVEHHLMGRKTRSSGLGSPLLILAGGYGNAR